VKPSNFLRNEEGNMLLEAVGFAALAFGLLLTFSLQVFDLERRQLGLEQIARNATRYFILNPDSDLGEAIYSFQALDQQFNEDQLEVAVRCQPTDCQSSGTFVWLELSVGVNVAKAFGVIP